MSKYTVSDVVNFAAAGEVTELGNAMQEILAQRVKDQIASMKPEVQDDFLGVEDEEETTADDGAEE